MCVTLRHTVLGGGGGVDIASSGRAGAGWWWCVEDEGGDILRRQVARVRRRVEWRHGSAVADCHLMQLGMWRWLWFHGGRVKGIGRC